MIPVRCKFGAVDQFAVYNKPDFWGVIVCLRWTMTSKTSPRRTLPSTRRSKHLLASTVFGVHRLNMVLDIRSWSRRVSLGLGRSVLLVTRTPIITVPITYLHNPFPPEKIIVTDEI